jgi:hypothetical protein
VKHGTYIKRGKERQKEGSVIPCKLECNNELKEKNA